MGYREAAVAEKPQITIDGTAYDLDYFGMDDGHSADPADAFRFIFQLGSGYMIYLYVIQASSSGEPRHFFHTFWLKDCAVAEVEMEDQGPPKRVSCESGPLPLLYKYVTVAGGERAVLEQRFTADFIAGGDERAVMTFTLDGEARLEWDRHEGWRFATGQGPLLRLDAQPRFNPPAD